MTEKSHTLAMRERVSTLFREVHSHSVAHFRASSGLFAEGGEPENPRLGGCAGSLQRTTLRW